jgi:hypothetical protein
MVLNIYSKKWGGMIGEKIGEVQASQLQVHTDGFFFRTTNANRVILLPWFLRCVE